MNSPLKAYCALELLSDGDVFRGPSSTPVTVIEPEGSASNTVPQTWKRGTFEAAALNVSLQTGSNRYHSKRYTHCYFRYRRCQGWSATSCTGLACRRIPISSCSSW